MRVYGPTMSTFRRRLNEIAVALGLLALWVFAAWLVYDALATGMTKHNGRIFHRDLNPFWFWVHVSALMLFVAIGTVVMALLAWLKPMPTKYDRHPRSDTPLDDARRRTLDNRDVA
jgi:uncharacterized BrkB/YihY/UPF0761 family membrane protein